MLLFGFHDRHANTSTENSPSDERHPKESYQSLVLKYIAASEARNPHRKGGSLETISSLLDAGVNIETPIEVYGKTLMIDALRFADIELFKLLVLKGAKVPNNLSTNQDILFEKTYKEFNKQCMEFLNSLIQYKASRRRY